MNLPTDKIAKDAKAALDALDRSQGGAVDAATAKGKKALTKLTKAVEAQLKKTEANLAESKEDLKQYPNSKHIVEGHTRSLVKTKKALEAARKAGSDHSSVRKALAQVYQWARDYGRKHAGSMSQLDAATKEFEDHIASETTAERVAARHIQAGKAFTNHVTRVQRGFGQAHESPREPQCHAQSSTTGWARMRW